VPLGIVNGRADVILDGEGGVSDALALVDYKTATDAGADDVFAFQLAIYAAAGRGEGINVRAAYLHELASGVRHPVDIHEAVTANPVRDRFGLAGSGAGNNLQVAVTMIDDLVLLRRQEKRLPQVDSGHVRKFVSDLDPSNRSASTG
jgi:hypothetical protein